MKIAYVVLICAVLFYGCLDNTPFAGPYPTEGLASWYNPRRTATGEKYRKNQLTCAMRKRDFGKYYLVCNLDNNKCVAVKHNDFGPSRKLFNQGRIIDLSRYAFSKIAALKKGIVRVKIGEIHSARTH
jgi:rare lipoprotein A